MAAEGEAARRDGKVSIHILQRAHSGCRSEKTAVVLKGDVELTKGPKEVIDHLYKYFSERSEYL